MDTSPRYQKPNYTVTLPSTRKFTSFTRLRNAFKPLKQPPNQAWSSPKKHWEGLKIRILKQASKKVVREQTQQTKTHQLNSSRQALLSLMQGHSSLAAALEPIQTAYERQIQSQNKELQVLKDKVRHYRCMNIKELERQVQDLTQENANLQRTLQQFEDSSKGKSTQELELVLKAERLKTAELEEMVKTLEEVGISVKDVYMKNKPGVLVKPAGSKRPAIVPKLPLSALTGASLG